MAEAGPAAASGSSRHLAIDAVRGGVMIIMALDHVRDFVHAGAMSFQPDDLTRTTPVLFFTRWVTHVCAPAFVFLAGIAAARRHRRHGSEGRLPAYLATRGLWLMVVELTILRFALNFRFGLQDPWLFMVLCALGLSMITLAPLVRLPPLLLGAIGVLVVGLHNLLDPVRAAQFGTLAPLWLVLHQQGIFTVAGQVVLVAYPMLPWAGLLAAGFAAGGLYDLDAAARRRVLLTSGWLLIALFVAVRLVNGYGDPQPWRGQPEQLMTLLSFVRTTKYPPSLLFLLMTVGPTLLALALFDGRSLRAAHPLLVFGRVPLFYYVVHFLVAHLVASTLVWWRYGSASLAFASGPFPSMGGSRGAFPPDFGWSLPVVYAVWITVVVAMYPLCRWYGRIKRERRWWWLAYG